MPAMGPAMGPSFTMGLLGDVLAYYCLELSFHSVHLLVWIMHMAGPRPEWGFLEVLSHSTQWDGDHVLTWGCGNVRP